MGAWKQAGFWAVFLEDGKQRTFQSRCRSLLSLSGAGSQQGGAWGLGSKPGSGLSFWKTESNELFSPAVARCSRSLGRICSRAARGGLGVDRVLGCLSGRRKAKNFSVALSLVSLALWSGFAAGRRVMGFRSGPRVDSAFCTSLQFSSIHCKKGRAVRRQHSLFTRFCFLQTGYTSGSHTRI